MVCGIWWRRNQRRKRIAVPLIGDHPVGTCSRPSPPAGSWHPDALQHRDQLGAIVALPRRDDDGERPPLPIRGHVELGRQPAPTARESLVAGVLDPLFLVGPTGPAPRPAHVLMCAGDRAIDAYLPHYLPHRIRARLHAGENPDPGAVASPTVEPVGAGLPRSVALAQIAPGCSRAQLPHDAVDDCAMVAPLPA